MSDNAPVTDDRLLEHYTDVFFEARGPEYGHDRDKLRAALDADPSMRVRLGRTDGGFGYLRALVIAGIATVDECNDLASFAG